MNKICPFVDRDDELEALYNAYKDRPLLAVIYGRRRLGKTRLVKEFMSRLTRERMLYYTASLAGHQYNLRLLIQTASQTMGGGLESVSIEDLSSALKLLYKLGFEIIVIDEISYWVRASPRVVSELQSFIDEVLPETSMLLILLGSHVGVMQNHVIGGGAPLYGRARLRIKLGMIMFKHMKKFYPDLAPEDMVRLYALVGGIPFYNCLIRGVNSLREAVEILVGQPGSPLPEEPLLILRDELRDPAVYNTILSAVARGFGTPLRISQYTGVPLPHVSKYLSVLELLGLVRRDIPLFRRKGKYRVIDPPLRTYYTLIEPVRHLLELGEYGKVVDTVLGGIDHVSAKVWEELARDHLISAFAGIGFQVSGRLEHKGLEIDVALLNQMEKKAVVAEAKWKDVTAKEAEKIRKQILMKASQLIPDYEVTEALVFARSIKGSRPDWIITPDRILETH